MQSEGLYRIVKDYVPQNALSKKNSGRSWMYGYNEQYDMVVISRNGEIGEIINISGLYIALPKAPKECYSRSNAATMQYWERQDLPKELLKIQSIFHWNEMPAEFKDRWVDYIEDELSADRLKNAAATKKLAIFDAFEILNRIEAEREALEMLDKGVNRTETKQGFAERRSISNR